MLNKQASDAKKILESIKKDSELRAKDIAKKDELVKEMFAKAEARVEDDRKTNEILKKYYAEEAKRASKEVEKFNHLNCIILLNGTILLTYLLFHFFHLTCLNDHV